MNEREERLYGELLQGDATLKKPLAIVRYELSEREGIRVTDGILLMYEDKAVRYEDGALSGEITVDSISDVRLKTENGSVILLCNNNLLCRGVMRSKKEFAAFVKRLKYISEGKEYRSARYTSYCRGCGRAIEGESGLDFCMFCKPPRGTVKRLWRYTSGSRLFIFASVFCFFAVTLVGLLSPYVSKILVDDYIQPRNGYLTGFITVVLAMLSVSLLSRLIGILRSRLLTAASEKLIVRLRDDVFSKIQKLSVSNVARRTAGNLMHRVTRDTQEVQRIISNQLPSLIEQLLTLIGVSAIIITVEPLLSLIILIPIPIVFIAQRMFWSRVRRMYDMQWTAETAVETFLHDIFSGIRVVKSFGTEKLDEKKFHSMTDEECRISMRNEKFFAIFAPLVTYVITLGEIVLLYYVGSESIAGRMSLGDIAMYTSYVATVYGPIMWLGRQIRELSRGMRSAAKIFEILDEREDVPDNEAAERPPITGRIELKGVSFGYDESKEILHNISLSVSPGEMIGVVGRSGVGKSTLINLIMRMYDPDEGEVLIDGVNAKDIPQEHLRASIGAVLQETFLFSGSIYDNIAYAKENATREEVLAASKLAGAHSFIMKLPDAYNTKVGERGYTLSGGERQRVTIARALLHDPRILILDEATSALDTETEKQIQDALAKLIKDRTTIAIAHRLSTLRNATRLIVIDEGKIAEEGTHEELMRLGGIYYSLVMAQRQMGSIKKKES